MTSRPIIAIDPGVATGVAWWYDEFHKEQVDGGLAGLANWMSNKSWKRHIVICESFDPGKGRGKVYYSESSDIIGALKLMYIRGEINQLHFQQPSDYSVVPDDDVKQLNLWKPVQGGHATVALKHLLRFMYTRPEYDNALREAGL